jgi:hypothetical protein
MIEKQGQRFLSQTPSNNTMNGTMIPSCMTRHLCCTSTCTSPCTTTVDHLTFLVARDSNVAFESTYLGPHQGWPLIAIHSVLLKNGKLVKSLTVANSYRIWTFTNTTFGIQLQTPTSTRYLAMAGKRVTTFSAVVDKSNCPRLEKS